MSRPFHLFMSLGRAGRGQPMQVPALNLKNEHKILQEALPIALKAGKEIHELPEPIPLDVLHRLAKARFAADKIELEKAVDEVLRSGFAVADKRRAIAKEADEAILAKCVEHGNEADVCKAAMHGIMTKLFA